MQNFSPATRDAWLERISVSLGQPMDLKMKVATGSTRNVSFLNKATNSQRMLNTLSYSFAVPQRRQVIVLPPWANVNILPYVIGRQMHLAKLHEVSFLYRFFVFCFDQ